MLEELIRLSGLSPIFATTVVRRAVVRAGIDPDLMQRTDIDRVLPELERAIGVYVGERAAAERASTIRRILIAA